MIAAIEASRIWWLGRLLLPGRFRKRACESRNAHAPVLVDLGRRKSCPNCGTW